MVTVSLRSDERLSGTTALAVVLTTDEEEVLRLLVMAAEKHSGLRPDTIVRLLLRVARVRHGRESRVSAEVAYLKYIIEELDWKLNEAVRLLLPGKGGRWTFVNRSSGGLWWSPEPDARVRVSPPGKEAGGPMDLLG